MLEGAREEGDNSDGEGVGVGDGVSFGGIDTVDSPRRFIFLSLFTSAVFSSEVV